MSALFSEENETGSDFYSGYKNREFDCITNDKSFDSYGKIIEGEDVSFEIRELSTSSDGDDDLAWEEMRFNVLA